MPLSSNSVPLYSLIVCTYKRDDVLVETVEHLLQAGESVEFPIEILVVDQLPDHSETVAATLASLEKMQKIRYFALDKSGLCYARNFAEKQSKSEILIYCDDDIVPADGWLVAYHRAFQDPEIASVAGQVLHIGEEARDDFGSFAHTEPVKPFHGLYGANMAVRRSVYRAVGGSDENLGVHAYTEDVILADRLKKGGYLISYEPSASVLHLKHASGGCRITDKSQKTSEADKVFSKVYWLVHNQKLTAEERKACWKDILRQGPLRRENVVQFWRQPAAWLGVWSAFRRAKALIK